MGAPVELLGQARAFARDFPRDNMPPGFLWDVVDFVPAIVEANLTVRGKWIYGSLVTPTGAGDPNSGIYAPFASGDQVLVQTRGTGGPPTYTGQRVLRLNEIPTDTPSSTWTDLAAGMPSIQNPIWFSDSVGEQAIAFDGSGTRQPQLWRAGGVVDMNAAHKHSPVGTVWLNAVLTGGAPGETHLLRWTVAGQDLTAAGSFDANAFQPTAGRITGLQAMRSMVLIFHPSSIQRFRGGPLPNTAAAIDDSGIILEGGFERVGCTIPRTITTWQDQCIFADEHGVHITDGATIRSLTSMGGISYFWRLLYDGAATIAATIFLDYYIVTLRHGERPPLPFTSGGEDDPELLEALEAMGEPRTGRPPIPPIPPDLPGTRPPLPDADPVTGYYRTTLVCDLNRKQWFRISNVNALCLFSGGGGGAGSAIMEKAWAGVEGGRLVRIAPMFYPDDTVSQVDGNALPVLPRFETPWYRLGREGRKRIRFAYVSYDCRTTSVEPLQVNYLVADTVSQDYVQAGTLPATTGYRRFRMPVYKFPYGIAFYVQVTGAVKALRVYELGIEAQAAERSRV